MHFHFRTFLRVTFNGHGFLNNYSLQGPLDQTNVIYASQNKHALVILRVH